MTAVVDKEKDLQVSMTVYWWGPHFCSILIRLRTHTYAFATDIEKAFIHMKLHEANRDCTRFLWLLDVTNPASDLAMYRFNLC